MIKMADTYCLRFMLTSHWMHSHQPASHYYITKFMRSSLHNWITSFHRKTKRPICDCDVIVIEKCARDETLIKCHDGNSRVCAKGRPAVTLGIYHRYYGNFTSVVKNRCRYAAPFPYTRENAGERKFPSNVVAASPWTGAPCRHVPRKHTCASRTADSRTIGSPSKPRDDWQVPRGKTIQFVNNNPTFEYVDFWSLYNFFMSLLRRVRTFSCCFNCDDGFPPWRILRKDFKRIAQHNIMLRLA